MKFIEKVTLKNSLKFLAKSLLLLIFLSPQNNAFAAVAFGTSGAVVAGSTSLAVPHPASIVAGDLLVLVVGNKYPTNGPATPAGWTLVTNGQGNGGLGAAGVDSGTVYSTIFVKEAVGGETGNLTVTITAANTSMARMFRYTKGAGTVWSYAATNGADITAGTGWSVTGAANPGIQSGDMVIVGSTINGDVMTAWASQSVSATGATFTTHTERQDSLSAGGNDMALVVSDHTVTGGAATAAPVYVMTGTGTPTTATPAGASAILRIRELNTITLGDGTDPANSTVAPSSAITDLDAFTLVTSAGTDSVTALTVTLTGANSFESLSEVRITSDNGATTYFTAVANPASNTVSFSGGTPIPAGTVATQFKVRITPKTHAGMPVPAGLSYSVAGTVTAFTSTNAQLGTDATTPTTITVDNLSPAATTAASATPADTQITVSWTNPADADFSNLVVLRDTATIGTGSAPAEGSSPAVGSTCGGVACQVRYITNGTSFIDTGLTNGTLYYYRIFAKDTRGNYTAYSATQQVSATPAPAITITGYVNNTDTTLNFVNCATTGCGARIGGGAGFRQSVTITGSGFGADPGVGNRSSATNNIKVGTQQIATSNVTAWSATSITFLTDSSVATDTDDDWGLTEFGGTGALTVTGGGSTSAGVNFYVFPQVTSVTQPVGFSADTAREYDAGDTDGVITLTGTRFGSSQGTGTVTIVGQTSTVNSWTNTAIQAQLSSAIVDTTNTGPVSMTQGAGANGKGHTYANTLRVLPRITGFTPTSAAEGAAVTVNGNHLCQGASCPTAFGTNDKVTFNSSVQATVFTSWSATSIATVVPTGAVTGNVVVTSNTYTSNGGSFTVLSNTPAPPSNLLQWRNSGMTQSIAVEGAASSTPIYLSMTMEIPGISGGTLYPQVEYKPIGTAFVCSGISACASALEGTGSAGPGPATGSVSIPPTDNVYHWQARTCHNKGGTHTATCGGTGDYPSTWVSFGANAETATDFQIDTTAPAITTISSGTPGGNTATITWNTSGEISTSRVEYDIGGTFTGGYNCAGTSECSTLADVSPRVNAHSVTLSNLSSGTTYSYRVRSMDTAGNETISATNTFLTTNVNTPAKTTKSYINGATGLVSGATTYYFKVDVPETTPTVRSAYVEVLAIALNTGSVSINVNGVGARSYSVSATAPTLYRFLYKITTPDIETKLNLNDVTPCTNDNTPGIAPETAPCNTLTVTPSTTNLYVLSGKIITNYSYTP